MLSTSDHQTIPRDEMPFFLLVSARLAGDDDVFPVVFHRFAREAVRYVHSVGVVGVLAVECCAGCCGVVSDETLLVMSGFL